MEPLNNDKRVAEGNSVPRPKTKGLVLTNDDVRILHFIEEYRLLYIDHVCALTGRTYTRIHKRLKGMFDAGYLNRIDLPQQKDVYYITRAGLHVLLRNGFINEEEAERRIREHELKSSDLLNHELMIASIHVMLAIATEHSTVRLSGWAQGVELRDTVMVVEDGRAEKRTLEPDAFFTLTDTTRPADRASRSFFLEADRSSMPVVRRSGSRRMQDKFLRYKAYIESGGHTKKYGIHTVRILTITETPRRRDSLATDIAPLIAEGFWKYFLFGTIADLPLADLQAILTDVFVRPGVTGKQYPLMPLFAEGQASA